MLCSTWKREDIMARIAFHYFPKNSYIHRWDSRCKILGLLIITLTLLDSKPSWLLLNSAIILGLLILSRLPLKNLFHDLRNWAFFLLILFLFQALLTPTNGLLLGALNCWRLGLMIIYGIIFTATTRPREIRDSFIWFLKPFSFLPARRIGLMLSLSLRFFSLTLDQVEEINVAQRARLGDRVKNPFRRIKFIVLPLLRHSFIKAEEMTLSLSARGYQDELPVKLPEFPLLHLIPVIIFVVIFIIFRSLS